MEAPVARNLLGSVGGGAQKSVVAPAGVLATRNLLYYMGGEAKK